MSERGFFAETLKALREKAGLSQSVLAERSGVGVSTIRQFEYGRREPTYGTLVKLAQGLGVSLAAFDTNRGQSPPPAKAKRARKRKGE
jgi:transcriptional regulator with XRE-family HTH domain